MLGHSYNEWLRQQNLSSSDKYLESMARLRVVLQELQFLLAQEITMEPSRVFRVTSAINHLIVEIHLLDTSQEMTK